MRWGFSHQPERKLPVPGRAGALPCPVSGRLKRSLCSPSLTLTFQSRAATFNNIQTGPQTNPGPESGCVWRSQEAIDPNSSQAWLARNRNTEMSRQGWVIEGDLQARGARGWRAPRSPPISCRQQADFPKCSVSLSLHNFG